MLVEWGGRQTASGQVVLSRLDLPPTKLDVSFDEQLPRFDWHPRDVKGTYRSSGRKMALATHGRPDPAFYLQTLIVLIIAFIAIAGL